MGIVATVPVLIQQPGRFTLPPQLLLPADSAGSFSLLPMLREHAKLTQANKKKFKNKEGKRKRKEYFSTYQGSYSGIEVEDTARGGHRTPGEGVKERKEERREEGVPWQF